MEKQGKDMPILMVDDDPDDFYLLREAFEECGIGNDLRLVSDGDELLDYLRRSGAFAHLLAAPLPGLILLDLNMPKKDGREALREIKADDGLRHIPIVVYTTSAEERDVLESYKMGASSYVTKPRTFGDMLDMTRAMGRYWFKVAKLPETEAESAAEA